MTFVLHGRFIFLLFDFANGLTREERYLYHFRRRRDALDASATFLTGIEAQASLNLMHCITEGRDARYQCIVSSVTRMLYECLYQKRAYREL